MFKIYSALGGDLHRHCIAYDSDEPASSRSEREVVFLLRQILEGIKHMHDQDFVHLDIKVSTACGVDIVFELFLLSNVCLGLDFRDGVVTLRDLSKHSTVFLCREQIQSIYRREILVYSVGMCVISYFQLLLVLHFFMPLHYSGKLNICVY